MTRFTLAATTSAALLLSLGCGASSFSSPRPRHAPDSVTFASVPGLPRNAYNAPQSTERVPMFFPIAGYHDTFEDSWGAPREGHRHIGQDLFAPKLTPLVAAFDGTVFLWQNGNMNAPHFALTLTGDNGYAVKYMHLNNDTPGTNDGRGGPGLAYAPNLRSGQRVRAGQFLGWVGNSGNAETTPPHLHFELWTPAGVTNAYASLRSATRLAAPRLPEDEPALPGLTYEKGETRLDGMVQTADGARGVVSLTPLVETRKGNARVVTRPGARWVRLGPGAKVTRADATDTAMRLSSLRYGDRIFIVGRVDKARGSLVARTMTVQLSDTMPFQSGSGGMGYGVTRRMPAPPHSGTAPGQESSEVTPEKAAQRVGNQISNWWNGVKRRGRL